jgi:hypothetical protein
MAKAPPVPPTKPQSKGPCSAPQVTSQGRTRTEARKRHLGEQGRQGNIKQNTTTKATSRTGDANPRPRTSGSANSNATRLSCGLSASPNRGRRASSMTLDTTSG